MMAMAEKDDDEGCRVVDDQETKMKIKKGLPGSHSDSDGGGDEIWGGMETLLRIQRWWNSRGDEVDKLC